MLANLPIVDFVDGILSKGRIAITLKKRKMEKRKYGCVRYGIGMHEFITHKNECIHIYLYLPELINIGANNTCMKCNG